ncbi:MAG: hypothetical protein ACI8RD_012586 [Bacillariaceae sp.]
MKTIHSSLGFFVSGQQQQIGFPDLIPTFLTFGLISYIRERKEEEEKITERDRGNIINGKKS